MRPGTPPWSTPAVTAAATCRPRWRPAPGAGAANSLVLIVPRITRVLGETRSTWTCRAAQGGEGGGEGAELLAPRQPEGEPAGQGSAGVWLCVLLMASHQPGLLKTEDLEDLASGLERLVSQLLTSADEVQEASVYLFELFTYKSCRVLRALFNYLLGADREEQSRTCAV